MITRTIFGLACGLMVFTGVEVCFGQSDTNVTAVLASSTGEVQVVEAAVDSNAVPAAVIAPVPAPAPVAAESNTVVSAVVTAAGDTNAAAEATAPHILTDPMDQVRETMYGAAESRSQHAARINTNIFIVSSIILTVFIILRLALLWKITKNRKKLGRENSFDN